MFPNLGGYESREKQLAIHWFEPKELKFEPESSTEILDGLVDLLNTDRQIYEHVVESPANKVSRDVCHGKLTIITNVLEYIKHICYYG